MDFRDQSIITQVAFKGAVDLLKEDIDITTGEGQAQFEQAFSYLTNSLLESVNMYDGGGNVGELVQGQFPGTFSLRIKGQQFGPVPDWAIEAAQAKGITEVYDNRDRAQGTKRPWFKSTGTDGTGIWPPDR